MINSVLILYTIKDQTFKKFEPLSRGPALFLICQ